MKDDSWISATTIGALAVIGVTVGFFVGVELVIAAEGTESGPQYMPLGFQIMGALLTPTIAAAAVYIALQQTHINKLKLRFDLFDRRIELYDRVQNAINVSTITTPVPDIIFRKMSVAHRDARFLFGRGVSEVVGQIEDSIIQLQQIRDRITSLQATGQTAGQNWDAAFKRQDETLDFLHAQREGLYAVMAPYMIFPKP